MTKILHKTALITGAAKRIGRAIASALAYRGFGIVVHYGNSRDEALEFVAELEFMGVKATAVQADLSDPESVSTLMKRAIDAMGPIQILVNNASIFQNDTINSLNTQTFQLHQQTNLYAPLQLIQAFAAQPNLPDDANIINIIDQRVLRPSPAFFSYALSKAGLYHATKTLAQELAPKIRVNGVGPGPVLQSIHQTAQEFDAEAKATLLQRYAWPEEVADAVLFLLGAASVTGQMICVDSGQHLGWKIDEKTIDIGLI